MSTEENKEGEIQAEIEEKKLEETQAEIEHPSVKFQSKKDLDKKFGENWQKEKETIMFSADSITTIFECKSIEDQQVYHLQVRQYEVAELEKAKPTFLAAQNMTKIRHSNCLRYFGLYKWKNDADEKHTVVCLVESHSMSLQKALSDKTYSCNETETLFHLMDMLKTLKYLLRFHQTHHGNINPNNILIGNNDTWKLKGFGFDTTQDKSLSKYKVSLADVVASHYHSAELKFAINDSKLSVKINPEKEDIWALGLVIYRCLSENHIETDFQDLNKPLNDKKQGKAKKDMMTKIKKFSEFWKELLLYNMVEYDVNERKTIDQTFEYLKENTQLQAKVKKEPEVKDKHQ